MPEGLPSTVLPSHWWQKPSSSMVHRVTTSLKSLSDWDSILDNVFFSTRIKCSVTTGHSTLTATSFLELSGLHPPVMVAFALSAGQESEPALILHFRICFLGPFWFPMVLDSKRLVCWGFFEKCYKEKEKHHWAGGKDEVRHSFNGDFSRSHEMLWSWMTLKICPILRQKTNKQKQTFIFPYQPVIWYSLPQKKSLNPLSSGGIFS